MYGDKLRIYRKSLDLTQQQLAEKLHIKRNSISNYENNKQLPDIQTMKLIADFFGVTINDMIEDNFGNDCGSKISKDLYKNVHEFEKIKMIYDECGSYAEDMLLMYSRLDIEDRAEIRGEMKEKLKNTKYKTKKSQEFA